MKKGNMEQKCANVTGIYDMKHKSNKRTHEVQLHNMNADISARRQCCSALRAEVNKSTLTTCHCPHIHTPPLQQSIDISFLPGPQQQTCSCGFAAVGPCWDGQTDALPFHSNADAHFTGHFRGMCACLRVSVGPDNDLPTK